ncbi:hypothetical protein SAMN05414139_08133 [Burkholderia sp. D7]|nr:hypothetical protein SAMN05414139_08133 [Burkholderia sp. D7]
MINLNLLRSSTPMHKKLRGGVTDGADVVHSEAERLVASHALFSGTVHLVNLAFQRRDQNNQITSIAAGDMQTLLEYVTVACPTILRYTSQYGQASVTVSQTILNGLVDVPNNTYDQGSLEDWVDTLAQQYGVSSNDCLCIFNPFGMVNETDRLPHTQGYHSTTAKCRYVFVNLQNPPNMNLSLADRDLYFAPYLSHELAEMIVDPDASSNPEVCDPCAGNCGHVTLNFFMRNGSFVGSVTDAPLLPDFDFYVEGVAQPAYVHQCPAPSAACGYFPEIWTRLGGSGYKDISVAGHPESGLLSLFALDSNGDAWRLDQADAINWGGWQSFGAHDLRNVGTAVNLDGRLELFSLGGDGHLYHVWQEPGSGVWGSWENLGGDGLEQICVTSDRSGALNVLAIRSGGECVWIKQGGPGDSFGDWTSLGGQGFLGVLAGVGLSGPLTVCVLDSNNVLQATDKPGTLGWTRISTPLVDQFSLLTGDDGKLHVVGISKQGDAFHVVQAFSGIDFASYEELGGQNLKSIATAPNADGRVEVFAVGGDGKIYHIWQQTSGGWSGWYGLGITQDVTFTEVRPIRTLAGTIAAFGLFSDGTPAFIGQTSKNGGWA